MNILFIVAYEGYHPIEYTEPKKILEAAGHTIITASNKKGSALAKDGSTTTIDLPIDQIDPNNYAGIFLVGGPGALEWLDTPEVQLLMYNAYKLQKPIGAICISTRILAHAGVLTEKKATGWDGDNQLKKIYSEYSVIYTSQPVVTDDHIVTAIGPEAAKEYGKAILALYKNQ
jgi:protease I